MDNKRLPYRSPPGFGRELLRIMLPALLLLVVGFAWIYRAQLRTDDLMREEQQRHRVQLAAAVIHQQLVAPLEDLAYLHGLGLFDDPDQPGFLPRLRQAFLDFASREGRYHTVRWLDNNGWERLRVDGGGASARVIPTAQLQDKSERYYFRESINRDPGEVFVSPMDLNIEQGEIEHPLRPVVRFATPVFDARGERVGVLVLNYEARRLLQRFQEVGELSGAGVLSLVNRQGYWLYNPDPALQWGFMLDTDARFAGSYPDAWRSMKTEASGQLQTEAGLFTYRSVAPPTQVPFKLVPSHGLQWKVVSRVPAEQIAAAKNRQLQRLALVAVPLALLLMLGSVWLARTRVSRLLALRQLARSERMTGTIVSLAPDAIITLDAQDRIVDFNPAAEEMFEYHREEVVGNPVLRVITPGGHRDRQGRVADYLAAGAPHDRAGHYHLQGRRADESTFPMEVVPACNEVDGESLQVLFIRDLSAELANREQQCLADTVFEHSLQAIMITDAGNRILRVNPAFIQITGYRPEEIVGRNPSILASGRQDATFYRQLWQTLLKQGRWSGELWNQAKNGRLFLERVSISAVHDEQGRIVNFVAIFNEVSPATAPDASSKKATRSAP